MTAILILGGMLQTAQLPAADGYFDTSWSGSGHFIVNPADLDFTELERIRIEPSGELFLAGQLYNGAASGWWLGEMSASGVLIPTFGVSDGSGFVTSCYFGLPCDGVSTSDDLRDALRQPDGKYLVLSDLELSRTTALAHSLDTAGVAGGTGLVHELSYPINDVQGRLLYASSLALLPDGKILVAGQARYAGVSTTTAMGILRLNSDLSLDTSFHAFKDSNQVTFAGGNVVAVDPTDASETALAILVQPDGSILLVGDGGNPSSLEVARLNADGSLDASYGTSVGGGKYPVSAISSASVVAAPFGRIIVATANDSGSGFSILRINEDGVNYSVYNQLPAACVRASMNSIAVDSAGRILAAGTCPDGLDSQHFIALRLRADTFALDPSFGVAGVSVGWFDASADFLSSKITNGLAIAIDASGHPVLGGRAKTAPNGQAGIARLTYDLVYTDRFESPVGCLPPDCN